MVECADQLSCQDVNIDCDNNHNGYGSQNTPQSEIRM